MPPHFRFEICRRWVQTQVIAWVQYQEISRSLSRETEWVQEEEIVHSATHVRGLPCAITLDMRRFQ